MKIPTIPQFSFPYTIVSGSNVLYLIAGEDFRYTLEGPDIDQWLPSVLESVDGKKTMPELEQKVPEPLRSSFLAVMTRLFGERVLVESSIGQRGFDTPYGVKVEGLGALGQAMRQVTTTLGVQEAAISILCQDALDYQETLDFNRQALVGENPWLWLCVGPLTRAYVSPIFLPQSGPCLECLITQFRKLSPFPELYDLLIQHKEQGKFIKPMTVVDQALVVVSQLALWKLKQAAEPEPSAAVYHLHVLELASFEISNHEVILDPFCVSCLGRR